LQGFFATDMDVLVLGNCLLHKADQPALKLQAARQRIFAAD
jgi:carbamoyltransferase